MTLNTMHHPIVMVLGEQQSDISVMVEVLWYHCHGSGPIYWCCSIHLSPIPSVLQHQGAMVGLTWPSSPCITPLTISPSYARIQYIWGGLWCVLPTIIAQGQYKYNSVGTSIQDLYQVCCNIREQWLGSHDPHHHEYTPNFGASICKNLIYLQWFKLCGAITMAQVHCNCVGTSSWDI